jgi:hypothetical protein
MIASATRLIVKTIQFYGGNMRDRQLLAGALTAGLAFVATQASAAILVVNDTFDVGASPTVANDGDDPLDIGWTGISSGAVGRANTAPAPATGFYLNRSASNFAGARGSLPNNPALSLAIGESLVLSFSFLYTGSPGVSSSGTGFRYGFFGSTGLGTVVTAGTGSGNTALNITHDTTATVDNNMGSGTNGTAAFSGPNDVVSPGTMTSGIVANTIYSATLSISRQSTTAVSLSASLNGATATVLDVNDAGDAADYLINFSSGYVIIRNGANDSAQRIDNVKVEIVPEPAALSLFALAAAPMLRRRRV